MLWGTCVFASGATCVSRGAFYCVRGVKRQYTIFHGREGPVRIPQKVRRDTLQGTCVFVSGAICVSRSVFWCLRGSKRRRTIFHDRVGPMPVPQEAHRDTSLRDLWVT
jgi:hypothetical protein